MASRTQTARRLPPARAEGELIRLTALQVAIIASIESGPKREQYGSRIIEDVAVDLQLAELPLATVYTALRRLEQRGLLSSRWGEPGPSGGNRRRFYRAAPEAIRAARMVGRVLDERLPSRRRG